MDIQNLKWQLPGWRIEQKYSPGVLIGNWSEDRYKFQKLNLPHNSTHRADFKHLGSHRPDVLVRRKCMFRNDGLPKDHLFGHHGKAYENNTISWYDEHYNGRYREKKLPEIRSFNSNKLGWIPEKTDHPLQGPPTNWGLKEKKERDTLRQIEAESGGDYLSTYSASYFPTPNDALVKTRFATAVPHSTSLHKANAVNKNLVLRGNTNLPISPERLPNAETDVNLGFSTAPIPSATIPMPT